MSWPIKSVSHDAELSQVIDLMIKEKISAVVVTLDKNSFGIVTHEDLLKVLLGFLNPKRDSHDGACRFWNLDRMT